MPKNSKRAKAAAKGEVAVLAKAMRDREAGCKVSATFVGELKAAGIQAELIRSDDPVEDGRKFTFDVYGAQMYAMKNPITDLAIRIKREFGTGAVRPKDAVRNRIQRHFQEATAFLAVRGIEVHETIGEPQGSADWVAGWTCRHARAALGRFDRFAAKNPKLTDEVAELVFYAMVFQAHFSHHDARQRYRPFAQGGYLTGQRFVKLNTAGASGNASKGGHNGRRLKMALAELHRSNGNPTVRLTPGQAAGKLLQSGLTFLGKPTTSPKPLDALGIETDEDGTKRWTYAPKRETVVKKLRAICSSSGTLK